MNSSCASFAALKCFSASSSCSSLVITVSSIGVPSGVAVRALIAAESCSGSNFSGSSGSSSSSSRLFSRFSYSAIAAEFTTLSSISRILRKFISSSFSIASSRMRMTRSPKSIMLRNVAGQRQIASWICKRPSSMRRAISISPSRVNSSTVPISRKYIRTGSSIRITVPRVVVSARSAESSLRKRSLRMA